MAPQICLKEVGFDVLNRHPRTQITTYARVPFGILVAVVLMKWGNFLRVGARMKRKGTRLKPLADRLSASPCKIVQNLERTNLRIRS